MPKPALTPTPAASPELEAYSDACRRALARLFEAARSREEVQFALALFVEFRGIQTAEEITAYEAFRAIEDFGDLIEQLPLSRTRLRVALALYAHTWEAAGLFETLKNMMNIVAGEDYRLWPFSADVRGTGAARVVIPPNANKTMKELLRHAEQLGLLDLAGLLLEGFDADLRHGFAHADYVLWPNGIYLRKRHGGQSRLVSYPEFETKLNKTMAFFNSLDRQIERSVKSYTEPKTVIGRVSSKSPPAPTTISFDPKEGTFTVTSRGPIR